MIEPILALLAGAVLLYVGGEGVVRGGSALARHLGIKPLIIGLTILAFGTSAPELFVSLQAAFAGASPMAVGNVVGSNIANIGLVLGLAAIIAPMTVQAHIFRFDVPMMFVALAAITLILLNTGGIGRVFGALLVLGLLVYVVVTIVLARREPFGVAREFDQGVPHNARPLWVDTVFVVGGIGLLVLGAWLFVDGAVALARLLQVPEATIGLTVVAIGTSLPEIATTLVAAVRREADIAVGNIVGSTIFNCFGILGLTALAQPLDIGTITAIDLGVMLLISVALLPIMRTGFRIRRWEGAVLAGLYIGYLVYLANQGGGVPAP